jgi:hypothetical protein
VTKKTAEFSKVSLPKLFNQIDNLIKDEEEVKPRSDYAKKMNDWRHKSQRELPLEHSYAPQVKQIRS